MSWEQGVNTTNDNSSKSVSFKTMQTLTLIPAFKNKDHSFMALARFELNSGSSTSQSEDKSGAPTGIETTQGGGRITGLSSNYSQNRSMYYTLSAHYAYKGRYIIDGSLRADGTTKFGPNNRWGFFPSLSLKWIISDELGWSPPRNGCRCLLSVPAGAVLVSSQVRTTSIPRNTVLPVDISICRP